MASMTDILSTLQNSIKTKVEGVPALKSIKGVIKGPLTQLNHFPIVSVIPVDEINQGLFNSQLRMDKRIRIEVIQFKLDQKEAAESSNELCNLLGEYFKVNGSLYTIPSEEDSILSSEVGNHVYSNIPLPFREGFLHISSFEVLYQVEEYPFMKTDGGVSYSTFSDTNNKEITDTIELAYRQALKPGAYITGVKSLKKIALGAHMSYPVLFIVLEDEIKTRAFTGKELNERRIAVNFITKELDHRRALEKNLEGIEKAKHVMFANSGWGGLVINSNYLETVYGQLTADGSILFGSTLRFLTSSIEKI